MKRLIMSLFFLTLMYSCGSKLNCADMPIVPVFISSDSTWLDTLILRQYKAGSNFQQLVDTVPLINGLSSGLSVSNDTFMVFGINILAGYDWQIFSPKEDKTILISDIASENASIWCGGLGEPLGCHCFNRVFSLKINDSFIVPSGNPPLTSYLIYIK